MPSVFWKLLLILKMGFASNVLQVVSVVLRLLCAHHAIRIISWELTNFVTHLAHIDIMEIVKQLGAKYALMIAIPVIKIQTAWVVTQLMISGH